MTPVLSHLYNVNIVLKVIDLNQLKKEEWSSLCIDNGENEDSADVRSFEKQFHAKIHQNLSDERSARKEDLAIKCLVSIGYCYLLSKIALQTEEKNTANAAEVLEAKSNFH